MAVTKLVKVTFTEAAEKVIEELKRVTGLDKGKLMGRALCLLRIYVEAKQQGKEVVVVKNKAKRKGELEIAGREVQVVDLGFEVKRG